ncbi:hypothetical protein [Pseudoduganella chitinolytica]|uniref:Uncharacterized protein n=1 Tax=Pseudoduganella chitinolytica TaxID=34070 RepID=A0ABY8B8I1_9BURK|nr:hypothetical protein [Pseudoduganella chitinolytica]WEF32210.1 hypothetical protein PX653_22760 [Pseudoduganella chitinolytica]
MSGKVGAAAGAGAAGAIADQEAAGAAKSLVNASNIRLKMEKAGEDNAMGLI